MITVRCTYSNDDVVTTRINATLDEARTYFLNQWFNLGTVEDNMQQCVRVELVPPAADSTNGLRENN